MFVAGGAPSGSSHLGESKRAGGNVWLVSPQSVVWNSMADNLGIDILEAIEQKLATNAIKYPVSKSKGRSSKYSEL